MKSKQILLLIFFIAFLVCILLLNTPAKKTKTINSQPIASMSVKQIVKVSRIVDGDTIKILINNKEDTVRLIGIDAPETVDPKKPIQCFGKEASAEAIQILGNKTIVIESDPTQGDRDEYGRLLRYVFLEDGSNFDEFMITQGYAREYTFKGNLYKYQAEFRQAQQKAKNEKKGLWGSC